LLAFNILEALVTDCDQIVMRFIQFGPGRGHCRAYVDTVSTAEYRGDLHLRPVIIERSEPSAFRAFRKTSLE